MIDLSILHPNNKEFIKTEIRSIARMESDKFEIATETVSISMKNSIKILNQKQKELQNQISDYQENNDGVPNLEDMQIMDEMMDAASDEFWTNEHLTAISEMKIIYLFKSIEITMKSLIKTGYPKVNTKDFYQWTNMVSYFKSVGIEISCTTGYIEVIELKKVNNSIKHNSVMDSDINKIREFKDVMEFHFKEIDLFYARVKPLVEIFLKNVAEQIIEDLFVFDESEITKLVDSYERRMDTETMTKFIDKLAIKNSERKIF